jgi:hypothetical protein
MQWCCICKVDVPWAVRCPAKQTLRRQWTRALSGAHGEITPLKPNNHLCERHFKNGRARALNELPVAVESLPSTANDDALRQQTDVQVAADSDDGVPLSATHGELLKKHRSLRRQSQGRRSVGRAVQECRHLRKELLKAKKQIGQLKQRNKLLTEENEAYRCAFQKFPQEFVDRLVTGNSGRQAYGTELMVWSLKLYSACGKSGYEWLRDHMSLPLPDVSTQRRRLASLEFLPGSGCCRAINDVLRAKAQTLNSYERVGGVSFDAMAIRPERSQIRVKGGGIVLGNPTIPASQRPQATRSIATDNTGGQEESHTGSATSGDPSLEDDVHSLVDYSELQEMESLLDDAAASHHVLIPSGLSGAEGSDSARRRTKVVQRAKHALCFLFNGASSP